MARNPWAFKIDYVKAIAEDQAMIDILSNHKLIAVCAQVSDMVGNQRNPHEWLIWETDILNIDTIKERAGLYGLSLQDVSNLLKYTECSHIEIPGLPNTSNDWFKAGKLALEALEAIHPKSFPYMMTEAKRKEYLTKYKTDLARHKRNQLKNK